MTLFKAAHTLWVVRQQAEKTRELVQELKEIADNAPPKSRAIIESVARRAWEHLEELGGGVTVPPEGVANMLALAAGVIEDLESEPVN